MWEKYKNENSGIDAYEIGEDYIKIRFKMSHETYLYNSKSPGANEVEKMKDLAISNRGLSTYISQEIGDRYYSKY
jgi:hypothetical protein